MSGLVAGMATLPSAPVSGPAQSAAWVAAWGGFALLPDMDHANGTAARLWGPVTSGPAAAVGVIFGGHRYRTHDAGAAPLVVAVLAGVAMLHPVSTGFVFALTVGLALVALNAVLPGDTGGRFLNFVLSVGAAALLVRVGVEMPWLPFAAAGGVLVHIAGDAVFGRVPVPFSTVLPGRSGRRLGLGFRTGYRFPVKVNDEVVGYRVGAELFVLIGLWLLLVWLTFKNVSAAFPAASLDDVSGWRDWLFGFGGSGGQPGFAPNVEGGPGGVGSFVP